MLDSEYLAQFTNKNIAISFFKRQNIPYLEYLIDKDSTIRANLQKEILGGMDFGRVPKRKELSNLFEEVRGDVNYFLRTDVKECPIEYINFFSREMRVPLATSIVGTTLLYSLSTYEPLMGFGALLFGGLSFLTLLGLNKSMQMTGSHYSINKNFISLKENNLALIKVELAHEFAHHVQFSNISGKNRTGSHHFNLKMFLEGHARGVQKQMAYKYFEKENNPAYLHDTIDISLAELKASYRLLCGFFPGVRANENLLNKNISITDKLIQENMFTPMNPPFHAVGNSIFSIWEALHGTDIYGNIINGDYDTKTARKKFFE